MQRFARLKFVFAAVWSMSQPTYAQADTGMLSITFDDATRVQFDNGLRIAAQHGVVGTLFVPTLLVRGGNSGLELSWAMSWDQVRAFHEAGWEIASHAQTHSRLTTLDPVVVEAELAGSISDIEEYIGVAPVSFSSPYGDFNEDTIAQIMEHYRAHLSWYGHDGRNPIVGLDPRYIGRLEVTPEMSAAEVCGEIVYAGLNGIWLVLLFHGIVDGEPAEYEVSTDHFSAILACAAELDHAGLIRIRTVRNAFSEIENRQ